jgi:hypothetical protein
MPTVVIIERERFKTVREERHERVNVARAGELLRGERAAFTKRFPNYLEKDQNEGHKSLTIFRSCDGTGRPGLHFVTVETWYQE